MKPILLDTGCVVALLDKSERHHKACSEAVKDLKSPLVTCEAVIAESCYLLRGLPGAPEAVLTNIERGTFHMPFRLEDAAGRVKQLMSRYRDVPMDFADACLVCLAEELKTGQILTLDGDFQIYRWDSHKRFEILVAV